MDIRCGICGKPWGFDTLHELAEELFMTDHYGTTYSQWRPANTSIAESTWSEYFDKARKLFQKQGCVAFGGSHNEETKGNLKSQAAAALMDVMGDDMDGVAAMLDDFEYLGMLDE